MSVDVCKHCGQFIDTDDQPGSYYWLESDKNPRDHPLCEDCMFEYQQIHEPGHDWFV